METDWVGRFRFKSVQIFSEIKIALFDDRDKKTSPLIAFRGEAYQYSTVPP